MKIIDAHLHLFPAQEPRFEEMAQQVGHHNSIDHLRQCYDALGMVHGVVMGNRSLESADHAYPPDLFHYCIGLDSWVMEQNTAITPAVLEKLEENLRQESCCGIKLYPGYQKLWLTDPALEPVYALSASYDKPVAIHMGLTATPGAYLKYAHPLVLDEAAADHPDTRFVMCHFGNPFLEAAAAVLTKNRNVAADLSGLLEGRIDLDAFMDEQSGYVGMLKGWLAATGRWDGLMFGTDWPIVNLGEYIEFIRRLIPQRRWDAVFFENANAIYRLGLTK